MSSRHTSSDEKLMQTTLKQRVKELEDEVSKLKTKLDQLRKAKNNDSEEKARGQKKEDATGIDKEASVSVLSMKSIEKQATMSENECIVKRDQEDSIRKLFRRISELNDENIALTIENKDLACKVAQLTSDLSITEAKRCEREEKMRAEISAEWRNKYDSWIEEMEKKMSEINLKMQ